MPVWLKDHYGNVEKIDFANAFDFKDAGDGNIIVSAYMREPPRPTVPRAEPRDYQIDFASFSWSGYTGVTNVEAIATQWVEALERRARSGKEDPGEIVEPELPLTTAPTSGHVVQPERPLPDGPVTPQTRHYFEERAAQGSDEARRRLADFYRGDPSPHGDPMVGSTWHMDV